jgi:YcaO-like protein with predicted kinase domain
VTLAAEARIGTPIRSPAGHAWPFAETERRLEGLLDRVPVTRVYDATALDRLGLPVWGAVTPLARDLTVHAGKGMTAQAARISAVMEAIERVTAEEIDPSRVRRASFRELQIEGPGAVVNPEDFALPCGSRYAPDREFAWVRGEDAMTGEQIWVALDLVLSPTREGIWWTTDTHGLAAGNTRVEAVLHAVYEVVERDADAQRRFLGCFGEGDERVSMRLLVLEALPSAIVDWVQTLRAAGLFVGIEELTHDLDIPVFRAVLVDRGFPGREGRPAAFEGLGCDLDSAQAVMRALSEAVQAHTTVLVGARDHFEAEEIGLSARRLHSQLTTPARRVTLALSDPPTDLEARLAVALERLLTAGLHRCVVVDLTREDLGIPVVRVLMPGACGPASHTARRPPVRLLRHLV